MNYLAHLFLSGDNEELMVGNFIADSVRGSDLASFSEGVQQGIRLHREIDSYTDRHPVVAESKNRLRPEFGKWPPVIVDVFYDHFLAAGWANYSDESLKDYSKRVYGVLKTHKKILPERVRGFLPYMIWGNWLVGYSKLAGIEQTLRGMSSRSRFKPEMHRAVAVLRTQYDGFQDEFERFFVDLREHLRTRSQVT